MQPALLLLSLFPLAAQQPLRTPLVLHHPVRDKNFYLLSKLEETPGVRELLNSDPELDKFKESLRARLHDAAGSCNLDLDCYASRLNLNLEDSAEMGERLHDLYRRSAVLKSLVFQLRQSGMFERYQSKQGDDLLITAWLDAVRGLDNVIEVYGTGRAPRYAQIDSVTYDVKSNSYRLVVRRIVETVEDQESSADLFFEPTLRFALYLMEANGRDEAGRLEPLDKGENAAAIRHIASIAWNRFPYSVIVVPGAGPDRLGVPLSPSGKMRLILAAKRFREHKAPLILVSGGYVHPVQTPFSEAVEMKKYLIANLAIPAEAILIDPQARHTTTNLRNAARQIYRYGIPFEKVALITTDTDQSRSIESAAFTERCLKELGYKPYQLRKRISPFDLEFVPVIDSLHADPMDPLDP